jgi:thiol:disulfide interchange protein
MKRLDWLVMSGALAVMLFVQWPMLKGMYYRAADATPAASRIEWRTDLESALREARRSNRPVLVDFSADWCPPCIAMKHDVWPDDTVEEAVIGSYVPLLIDIDRDGVVAEQYGVEAIPTVLMLDGHGRVLRRANFLSASGLKQFLDESE